jgi:putative transposase
MTKISYSGYRFPPEIIHQAIWLYLRFTLSFRDVEDLLAERGIAISYETVRRWVNHFGPIIAAELRKRRPRPHSIWHLDEVYLKIDGRMLYLWRAVCGKSVAGWSISGAQSTPKARSSMYSFNRSETGMPR